MAVKLVSTCLLSLILFIIVNSPTPISAKQFDYPTAKLSTSWINDPSAPNTVQFRDGSTVRAVLLRGTLGQRFACGFYCNGKCDSYLFAIFLVQTNSISLIVSPGVSFPQVVWSANRDHPVKINATLKLTADGELVLRDADGSLAWSTKTAGKSVAGLNLTDTGNLVLFNKRKEVVWQSFDHPTDSLVPGQTLTEGQKLIASVSKTNSGVGLYSLVVNDQGVFAYIQSNPSQAYFNSYVYSTEKGKKPNYVRFLNGSLSFYPHSSEKNVPLRIFDIPLASSVQYMRLESDGHLRVYEWKDKWEVIADLLTGFSGDCGYPLVCGKYSICSDGQCSCPGSSSSGVRYFRQVQEKYPNLGCVEINPLTCSASKNQDFVELKDVTYFTFNSSIANIDANKCKHACLKDCSCKAAIFRYGSDPSRGDCLLPSEVFSLMDHDPEEAHYNSTVYLKVQKKAIK
ncbi:Bulb-type lectin domain-containing protein [Heracleum sosnowskyi]|uniref:Bulb-type lectin domain-containing protein n=1 Tax=Heracleum sosnowskyi TaxID=360622 RepID=A0AAD8N7R1_9APIA|nr:Bulb-type lectin domain-containing protein [Heracleum sosnowskyi]